MFRPSAVALILANLVPLAGVLWLDWRVFDVLILYWAENVVIGAVNILRMLTIADSSRFFLVPFFALHYGIFCFGHYTAVVGLFGGELQGPDGGLFAIPFSTAWRSPLWIGVAAIAVSHLLSFYFNFLGAREYQRTTSRQLMQRPYGRIVVLHVTVIAGGLLVTTLGDPAWMLLVLIIMKTVIDLRMHERERDVLGPADTVS